MRKYGGMVLAIFCLVTAAGCASIIDGRRQSVSFSSDPSGAQVIINGRAMGVTPASIVLERSDYGNANIVFKKEGFQDQQATVKTSVNIWFWGNIIFGGLLGSSTDAASGAMWEFEPNAYYVSMPPLKASLTELDRFAQEKAVRRFLLFSYTRLLSDVMNGDGEYLASLYQVFSVQPGRRSEALEKLQGIAVSTNSAPTFARAVLDEFEWTSSAAVSLQVLKSGKIRDAY